MMKKITITIDRVGRPKIEAEGFIGGACLAATKPILDALSDAKFNVTVEEKSEMYLACQIEEFESEGV
jgi:hypothetical protein